MPVPADDRPPPASPPPAPASPESTAGPESTASPESTARLEVEASAAERVVFFSDAVVAIAMTLLAFGLPLPRGASNSQLLHSLLRDQHNRGDYTAFLISFVVIGGYWSAHRRTFRYVIRLGGRVASLNMLWLLMMVVTPFATRVLAGDGAFAARFTLYALVQVIAGLCLLLITNELVSRQLVRPDIPRSITIGDRVPALTTVMFGLSIPVAFVTHWAYAFWIATPAVAAALRRRAARRRTAAAFDTG